MWKRVYIALAVLFVAVVSVMVWQGPREPEPVYQGKRLSVWLENLYKATTSAISDHRAEHAIRQIGTNALPMLIARLRARDTPLKQMVMKWAQKQKLVHFHFKSAFQRRQEAILGYDALGPLASVQVFSLSGILTNDPSPDVRQVAAEALGSIGPEARLAAPALFRAAKDKSDRVRNNALGALGDIRPDPQPTIPVLVVGLDEPWWNARATAVYALGKYGPEARLAALAVFRATKDTDWRVRLIAFGALERIRPDPQLTIPVLVAGLEDSNVPIGGGGS
jgi:hypothetical protein